MVRLARVVAPGIPHHVIQRGNRRQPVFFSDEDRIAYLAFLKECGKKFGLEFWAYCLMDNHVHLIVVPDREDSLAKGLGEAHRNYTRMVHFREGWRGYLWQGRFLSYPLDEKYLFAAIRYIERNPVKAGMVKKAEDYPWSSAKTHVFGSKDSLLSDHFLKNEIQDWSNFLSEENPQEEKILLEKHTRTGRPLGGEDFLDAIGQKVGRILEKQKPGPKRTN